MGIKNLNLIFFIFWVATGAAQKTEILHRSDYKHEYVLQRADYLEELKDTLGCRYIATLNVQSKIHVMDMEETMNLIGIKAKELGANMFYIQSYSGGDTSANMIVKLHYAFKKTYDLNRTKRIKNKIACFSFVKRPNRYLYFYLNDSLKYVNSMNYFKVDAKIPEKYNIKPCNTSGVTATPLAMARGVYVKLKGKAVYKAKEGEDMVFIVLYSNDFVEEDEKTKKPKQKVMNCGLNEAEYRTGRMLMEIYKCQN